MIARMLCGVAVATAFVGSCETFHSTTEPADHDGSHQAKAGNESGSKIERAETAEVPNPDVLDCEPPLACSMAGRYCPSSTLPRVQEQLDAAGWLELKTLASERMVALALDPASAKKTANIVESCRLPGRYLEVVAAPSSPGRAWAADRLVFTPDEPRDCTGATHFVAAFTVHDDQSTGAAIALPLPCPAFGSGKPKYCIGTGLDDDARLEQVRSRWEQITTALRSGDGKGSEDALALLVDVAALQPEARNYINVAKHLRQIDERYGGCLWLSEASFAARALDPSFESTVDLSQGRVAPSHAVLDCATRPSLLTCFPEHFVPGVGDNCW
jgi:hypothetical protein